MLMDESWKHDRQKAITQRRRIRSKSDAVSRAEADLWAVDHRGKPAIKPPPPAGRALAKVLRPLSRAFGPGASELEEHWEAIVGEALARWTSPEKLQSGTLTVRARGPAAALIEAQSGVILERVAQYAGRAPKRLRIVQGSLAAPAGPVRRAASRVIKRAEPLPEPPADPAERLAAALADFEAAVREREGG
ncbi:hypothetical protein GCM10007417_18550 [Glycocaulis alkaliphilus]|nr:hypothetical protein GCM10007417_18550 [Glycocaulis alkaliphilus]